MNWNDPSARLTLIDRVGATEYNRLMQDHQDKTVVSTVNDRKIRIVHSRFGKLYAVSGTNMAFKTQDKAEAHAKTL